MCLVTLGSAFGTTLWMKGSGPKEAEGPLVHTETMKTRMVSVPLISDDQVQGYLVARFEIVVDSDVLKDIPFKSDVFVADEAFRAMYGFTTKDFRMSQKQDLQVLTSNMVAGANKRMGAPVVKDVLIDSWTYVTKQDMMKSHGNATN